jgi:hypothetical protein
LKEVYAGRMTCEEAQHAIATEWIADYQLALHSRARIDRHPVARALIAIVELDVGRLGIDSNGSENQKEQQDKHRRYKP